MVLYFSTKVKVRATMPKHIKSVLDTSPTDMDSLVETPASNHLFQVQYYCVVT